MRDTRGRWAMRARAAALALCAVIAGCAGGGGNGGGPNCGSSVVSVSIEPGAATVVAGTTQPFVAAVTGTANTAVTWSVQEAGGGTISATGVYTAPTTTGTYHIVATSQGDSCGSEAVTVTVVPAQAIAVSISPRSPVTLQPGGSQTFVAAVTGTANTAVTWTVQGTAGGSISTDGVYTVPQAATGSDADNVIATSIADPAKSDRVVVVIDTSSPPILISPTATTVGLGGRVEFSLSASSGGVWSVNGVPGGNTAVGTINLALGTYTAPFQMPTSTTVIKVTNSFVAPANSAAVTLASRFLALETLQVDGCVPSCPADIPNAIVAEDFNGDGWDDLATANAGSGTVSLLMSADASHFAAPVRYWVGDPSSSEPQALAAADFDSGNQGLDLAIADASPSGLAIRTRLGVGDGAFGDEHATSLPLDRTPLSIAVGFLDSDPDLDIAVANLVTNTVDIFQGVGDGTFRLINTLTTGVSGPVSIISANFDVSAGDLFDDLAVANSQDGAVSIFLSNADGTFDLQSVLLPAGSPSAVAVVTTPGTLNGDNHVDLVVTAAGTNELTVLLNTADPSPGGNRFTIDHTVATGQSPVAVATGDFNRDGVPDVVVVNQGGESVTTYLFDPVTNALVQSETYGVGLLPQAVAVGDFNGDGWPDVAVSNSGDDTVSVLRNRGGPTTP